MHRNLNTFENHIKYNEIDTKNLSIIYTAFVYATRGATNRNIFAINSSVAFYFLHTKLNYFIITQLIKSNFDKIMNSETAFF